jgi:hypothetical protein
MKRAFCGKSLDKGKIKGIKTLQYNLEEAQMKNSARFFCVVLAAMLATTALVNANAAEMPKFLTIKGTGTPGAIMERLVMAVIANAQEAYPEVTWRNIPGGTKEGVLWVIQKKVDIGVTNTSWPYMAWYGKGFEGQRRDIRCLFNVPFINTTYMVVLADSNISGFKDLGDKRICPGMPGYTSTKRWVPAVLGVHDISYESIKKAGGDVIFQKMGVGQQMLADGKVDATLGTGPDPSPRWTAMASLRPIRMLPFTKRELEAATEAAPGFGPMVLPGGIYKGQEKTIDVLGYGNTFIVRADMPEDVIYNLVKAIFKDRGARFKESVPQYKGMDLVAGALDHLIIPLHPGAERYWREQGLEIPKPLIETKPPT